MEWLRFVFNHNTSGRLMPKEKENIQENSSQLHNNQNEIEFDMTADSYNACYSKELEGTCCYHCIPLAYSWQVLYEYFIKSISIVQVQLWNF